MRVIARPGRPACIYARAETNVSATYYKVWYTRIHPRINTHIHMYTSPNLWAMLYRLFVPVRVHEGAFSRLSRIEIRRSTCGTFAGKGRWWMCHVSRKTMQILVRDIIAQLFRNSDRVNGDATRRFLDSNGKRNQIKFRYSLKFSISSNSEIQCTG